MPFSVKCECGREMLVDKVDAGARLPCECGETVLVPSMGDLRKQAGLAAVQLTPEAVVRKALSEKRIPPNECVGCKSPQAKRVSLVAQCEESWSESPGDSPIVWILLSFLFTAGHLIMWKRRNGEQHGRDSIVPVPVRLCGKCHSSIRRGKWYWLIGALAPFPIAFGLYLMAMEGWVLWPVPMAGIVMIVLWLDLNRQHMKRLRVLVSTVPEYSDLLDAFPGAQIQIH